MSKRKRKPKYYVKPNWYLDWTGILQVSNNVVVAICPEQSLAEVLCDILNDLPRGVLAHQLAQKSRKKGDEL
jgi:hypothetical protein